MTKLVKQINEAHEHLADVHNAITSAVGSRKRRTGEPVSPSSTLLGIPLTGFSNTTDVRDEDVGCPCITMAIRRGRRRDRVDHSYASIALLG